MFEFEHVINMIICTFDRLSCMSISSILLVWAHISVAMIAKVSILLRYLCEKLNLHKRSVLYPNVFSMVVNPL